MEPTSLQEALNTIRKKDLKIEELTNKVKELENEVETQKKLVGLKRIHS